MWYVRWVCRWKVLVIYKYSKEHVLLGYAYLFDKCFMDILEKAIQNVYIGYVTYDT